jgi:ubiquinone/menaquinone biosynthesis C-methylase UbiE
VLDCGSGAGDVAFLVAELVTTSGEVVGVDRDVNQVIAATRRSAELGLSHVGFISGDILDPPPGPFDAVVGRFVLMYHPEPEAVLRRLAERLAPGGTMAFLELNMPATRIVWPPSPLMDQIYAWINEAFAASGVQQRMGVRLPSMFRAVGLRPEPPHEAVALAYQGFAAVEQATVSLVRSALPMLIERGIATEREIDIDTLAQRMRAECGEDPTLVAGIALAVWATKA